MDFRNAIEFVSYLESGSHNPRMQRKLAELKDYLISQRRKIANLQGLY
jgi:hypothetical protein